MKRRRWIVIGRIHEPWFVRYFNWGIPGGLYIHWMGRVGWGQPCEFWDWRQMGKAVEYRLRLAGLALVALAYKTSDRRTVYRPLWALVERLAL